MEGKGELGSRESYDVWLYELLRIIWGDIKDKIIAVVKERQYISFNYPGICYIHDDVIKYVNLRLNTIFNIIS